MKMDDLIAGRQCLKHGIRKPEDFCGSLVRETHFLLDCGMGNIDSESFWITHLRLENSVKLGASKETHDTMDQRQYVSMSLCTCAIVCGHDRFIPSPIITKQPTK